ncbi:hypothetical protein MTO96_021911 [Rhipicephalus appendiculatus]
MSDAVNGGSSSADVGVVIGVSMALLILIIAAIFLTIYCIRKRRPTTSGSETSTRQSMKDVIARLSKNDEYLIPESRRTQIAESNDYLTMTVIPHGGLPSKPVSVLKLEEYVSHGERSGVLKGEFMTTAKGQLHPWDVALKPENKPKNRYEDILPCPMKTTMTDFWRMVWQEGCCKVVMLTNLEEQGKTKCEQYWPDTSKSYGKFVVKLLKTETQVDFVVREFEVSLKSKTRIVVQFHFTSWPENGVPVYPDALVPFLKRIWRFQPRDDHPIIVHCSRGTGRTGTLILVDSMASQAEAEGEVDLIAHLHKLHQSRTNLLDSEEQYIFAYKALVEILRSKRHTFSAKEFRTLHEKLKTKSPDAGKSVIEVEYEEVARMCLPPAPEQYKSALDGRNAAKNRSPKILACDSRRPFLSCKDDESKTDYINAVYVDGFEKEKCVPRDTTATARDDRRLLGNGGRQWLLSHSSRSVLSKMK